MKDETMIILSKNQMIDILQQWWDGIMCTDCSIEMEGQLEEDELHIQRAEVERTYEVVK